MNEIKTNTVARINNVDIVVIENGSKRVPLKPICEALGVDFSSQLQKVKDDEILGSTVVLSPTVGADGKEREMATIPFMFVFGWIFGISAKNVKEEAREALIKYKLECYVALFNHFSAYSDFIEAKQTVIEQALTEYEEAKDGYTNANRKMKDSEKKLKQARELNFTDFDAERRQLKMFSDDEMKGGKADE